MWGDTAEEAYRRTIEVINQAVEFVNERTAGDVALRRPPPPRPSRPAACCATILPALRGAVSSERAKVLVVDTLRRACSSSSPPRDAGAR